jgi:hypothetical protein
MKSILLIILIITVLGGVMIGVKFAAAAIGFPFGGRVLSLIPCNLGIVIDVGQPRPVVKLLITYVQWASTQFVREWYAPLPGASVMGIYLSGGGTCPVYNSPGIPFSAVLEFMGTSLR